MVHEQGKAFFEFNDQIHIYETWPFIGVLFFQIPFVRVDRSCLASCFLVWFMMTFDRLKFDLHWDRLLYQVWVSSALKKKREELFTDSWWAAAQRIVFCCAVQIVSTRGGKYDLNLINSLRIYRRCITQLLIISFIEKTPLFNFEFIKISSIIYTLIFHNVRVC